MTHFFSFVKSALIIAVKACARIKLVTINAYNVFSSESYCLIFYLDPTICVCHCKKSKQGKLGKKKKLTA